MYTIKYRKFNQPSNPASYVAICYICASGKRRGRTPFEFSVSALEMHAFIWHLASPDMHKRDKENSTKYIRATTFMIHKYFTITRRSKFALRKKWDFTTVSFRRFDADKRSPDSIQPSNRAADSLVHPIAVLLAS